MENGAIQRGAGVLIQIRRDTNASGVYMPGERERERWKGSLANAGSSPEEWDEFGV